MNDTGLNVREARKTLLLQQVQLIFGKRQAQMFPIGTEELLLPPWLQRVETDRGVFHFNPHLIHRSEVVNVVARLRENEILGLGPFNKADILQRMRRGESLMAISELAQDGTEIKSAAATESTLDAQRAVFDVGKLEHSHIRVEPIWDVIERRRAHGT